MSSRRVIDAVNVKILIGWVKEHLCSPKQEVKGCIIAHAEDEKLQYALKQVPSIRFMKYEVDFRLVG